MCLVVSDTIFFQTSGLLNPAIKSANAHLYKAGVYILRLRSCPCPHFSPVLIERFNAKDAPRCVIYIKIAIRKIFIDILILAFCDLLREFLLWYWYSFFCCSSFSIFAYLFFLLISQLRVLNWGSRFYHDTFFQRKLELSCAKNRSSFNVTCTDCYTQYVAGWYRDDLDDAVANCCDSTVPLFWVMSLGLSEASVVHLGCDECCVCRLRYRWRSHLLFPATDETFTAFW
jgi:hypothetical protein